MSNDLKVSELIATPATFSQPVSMEPNLIFHYEVENEFEPLDWTSLSFFEGPQIGNVLLSQPIEVVKNFYEEGAIELSTEVDQSFVVMDLVGNGSEVSVTESPIQLEMACSPNGGEQTPVPSFYEGLHEFQVDAPVQIQAGNLVPSALQMDPPVELHSGAPVTKEGRTFNNAEIAALLQEAEELDRDNEANMPSERTIDPPAGSGNNIQSNKVVEESNEAKRLRKNAYSKRYRENMKTQRQKLERENAFYKQHLAKSYKVIRLLQMRDAQLDSKIQYLIPAQVTVNPENMV